MKDNPYVGPRPYERKDRHNFYGREREARELRALIVAEREVLFYAQSGAGKTSLLNAMVIPALEEKGFHVLPVARVGSELPPGVKPEEVDNIFAFSTLTALAGEDVSSSTLLHCTLRSFLKEHYPESKGELESRPLVLIFDQFEELFTAHRERWQDAQGFFVQVRETLDALRHLGVVFAMREDHVAELDPYVPLFPRRLRARFRMERLGPRGALAAAEKPAQNAGCPFDPGVAQRLVDNLRLIKVQHHAGLGERSVEGPFVEPVQLQVVCHRLWENLPEQKDHAIQWEEVEQYGNIDRALTDFYKSVLDTAMRQTSMRERTLRRWFSQQLITPAGTRGLVMRGLEDTAGLPNAAVDVFERQHIIRADVRAGARWYELVHDRLIDPILASNRAWEEAQETPLRTAARRWGETQDTSLLYRDAALKEALAWAEVNPEEVEPYEADFLEASQQAAQARARAFRLRRNVTIGLVVGLVIMAALTVFALYGWREAQEQNRIALARQLAAQAEVERNDPRGSWTLASLLAVESIQRVASLEANITLNRLLGGFAQPVVRLEHERDVNAMALSPDGRWVVSGSADGKARVWEVRTGQETAYTEHNGSVNAVAFSPDGRWVVSGSGGCEQVSSNEVACSPGEVKVWEAATGEEVAQIIHEEPVYVVAFSPDGRWVASGSGLFAVYPGKAIVLPGDMRVWEAATGEEVARMAHKGPVYDVAFGPGGRWVASASGEFTLGDNGSVVSSSGKAQVWEAATGEEVARITHGDIVRAVAFSPNGRLVASGSDDQTVQVWEVTTGEKLTQLEHDGRVFDVTFSTDGQWIISGADDLKAWVWETATGQEVAVMRGHGATIVQVEMSSDNEWIVTASNDHTARVWDVDAEKEVARMEHEGQVTSVAFAHGDQWVLSGGRDGTVRVWNVSMTLNERRATGREVARIAHEDRVNVLAVSPDNHKVVSGGDDGAVWIWDIGTLPETRLATGREMGRMASGVKVVAFSPSGSWLVSGDKDGTLQAWEAATGRPMGRVKHEWEANSVAFSPNEQWAVSGGGDGTAMVWEIATGYEIARMNHGWEVNAVAVTPDGEQIVSASRNGSVLFWDAVTGREVNRVAYPGPWTAVALTADGQWAASGWHDGTVRVWEAATGREVAQMKHEREVLAVAFSADGKWVMTSSFDGTARVWEVVSGMEVSRIEHAGWADNVTFSRDGRWIVTISYDTAWIWWWQAEDLTTEVCSNLSRNLTSEEWRQYIGDELYHPTCSNLPLPEK